MDIKLTGVLFATIVTKSTASAKNGVVLKTAVIGQFFGTSIVFHVKINTKEALPLH